jgi:hypothetical protein
MHSFSGLWGIMATGLVVLWGQVAIAQSSGSPNERATTSTAAQPSGHSTIKNSLICDSSGKLCVATGQRLTAPSAAAASTPKAGVHAPARAASVAVVSPPRIAAPESRPKQRSLAPTPLICDATGTICDSVSGRRTQGQVSEMSSVGHAAQIRIDGVRAYDGSSGLVTDDPFDWAVRAYKSQHRLEVYFKSHLYRSYHAVFGRSLAAGAKVWEGDRRTPEGSYLIVSKHRSARFGWFLHINYPNAQDQQRFEESRAAHVIPASANEGGQIGIHGTDSPYLNVADINWTTGCISVDNADIGELARLLPIGTLVIINP